MRSLADQQTPERARDLVNRSVRSEVPPAPNRQAQAIRRLQTTLGNRALQRLLQTAQPVQAKLRVTDPGDRHELEADRAADTIAGPAGADLGPVSLSPVASPAATVGTADRSGGSGSGQALGADQRAHFEPRFDHDFSGVRIHADAEAAGLNRQLGARAFTYGRDVYFAEGQYDPQSPEGKHLLAHELAHVVQQQDQPGYRSS